MKLDEIELNYMGVSFTMEDLKKYMKNNRDCEISKIGGLMYFRNKINIYSEVNYNYFESIADHIRDADSGKTLFIMYVLKKLKNKIPDLFLEIIKSEDEDFIFDNFRYIFYKNLESK